MKPKIVNNGKGNNIAPVNEEEKQILSIVISDYEEEEEDGERCDDVRIDEDDDEESQPLSSLVKSRKTTKTDGKISDCLNDETSPLKSNQISSTELNPPKGSENYFRTPSTHFSSNKNEEFNFDVPPECPIFSPSEEEFKNPLVYINKIRPVAEKYGICKIKPPSAWQPPFTVDVDKLKFTPRVQRLNELEAKTRVKLNFLDQIAKFWELQGSSLKIPMVERKALDLYSLHRIVQEEGGIEQATNNRRWSKVAERMGYPQEKRVGTILKNHYERILFPFDVYTSGKHVEIKLESMIEEQEEYKPHDIESRQQVTPPQETTARRSKRFAQQPPKDPEKKDILTEIKKEVDDPRFIPFYAACLKSSMFRSPHKNDKVRMGIVKSPSKTITKRKSNTDILAKYICHTCERGDFEEAMLLCDGCDDSYHTFCLIPPLTDIPKGEWRCPKCVVEEVNKPIEAFGFEQAQREYTLQQFGEMADNFKAEYFSTEAHSVPTELVEREFWRIVSSIDEDVTVEYGADLHTMDHGSGFPTKSSLNLSKSDQEYAESNWNLNNLPILEESVLGHINADISGMKVPWMYVGMCFSAFCWHIEDHWSYSINYMHWGEPKTWYGIPGNKAEEFEETMKKAAPELFQSQPDLLHQLVTIMNPNISMKAGIPIYRTDQHAGEFVVTFPRAYHAGFNQGYNFAEAVNFAPADWIKMGRECINHYSTLRRFCVFSHDELICKMALEPEKLNFGIATACYLDMAEMVDSEKKLRKSLLEWGVTKAERISFELLPDDERQCEVCKTTCFLSAVICSCTKKIVCLRHYSELCECPSENHTLQYRYTLDELPLMLKKLKQRTESFEAWLRKIHDLITPQPNTPKITFDELQVLTVDAETKKFANTVLLDRLKTALIEAEKCITVIQQLDISKIRSRRQSTSDNTKYKLSMEELDMFIQEIDNLWCTIVEGESVKELQAMGKEFIKKADLCLNKSENDLKSSDIEDLIEEGGSLCIELPQVDFLKDKYCQIKWYENIKLLKEKNNKIMIPTLKKYITEGESLTSKEFIKKELINLKTILTESENWEKETKKFMENFTENNIPDLEKLMKKAEKIPINLPSFNLLKEGITKINEWNCVVKKIQANENYPYMETVKEIVNRGKIIPFKLEELCKLEEHLSIANDWKNQTSKTFLNKKSFYSLLEVLSPRINSVMLPKNKSNCVNSFINKFNDELTPVKMLKLFKECSDKEIQQMLELRKENMKKEPDTDKYCICESNFYGVMYNCQLCKNWFHAKCVQPPQNPVRTTVKNGIKKLYTNIPVREVKYLCMSCMRSKRPRLETVLPLLVSLQKLSVRIPEGEALQCLVERALNWQDRTKQFLLRPDIKRELERIKQQTPSESSTITIDLSSDDETGTEPVRENQRNDKNVKQIEKIDPILESYINRKEKTDPIEKAEKALITLSDNVRVGLEKLMIEGDLLEVSLDETNYVWNLLNASKEYYSELASIHYRYIIKEPPETTLVSNNINKPRKSIQKRKLTNTMIDKGESTKVSDCGDNVNNHNDISLLSSDTDDDEIIMLNDSESGVSLATNGSERLSSNDSEYIPKTKKRVKKLNIQQSLMTNFGVDSIAAAATAIVAKATTKKKRDKKKKLLRLLSSTKISLTTTALG